MNKNIKNKLILALLLIAPILGFSQQNQTSFIGFAWDASPDFVSGYNLVLNNTNIYLVGNVLSNSLLVNDFKVEFTNTVHATAYDTNNNISEPSNVLKLYRPYSPFSLSYKYTNNSYIISWAAHTNNLVNKYYLFIKNTNTTKLSDISGRTNNSYTLYPSNLIRGMSNYVTLIAYGTNVASGGTTNIYVLESSFSTNLFIPPVLSPPNNFKINVIVQSSTNLFSWNNLTNYIYEAENNLTNEFFRAQLEIAGK